MNNNISDNNSRIAKNTLLLYVRMFFSMLIGLYTSRVVLNTLGVIDYGIYNVVSGVVVLFVFVNSAMANATQRFITYELGKKDDLKLNKVFCISVNLHILLGILIVILCESIGIWFIYNKLVVPVGRLSAAMYVFQFSILSTFVSIISVPYNSLIIAYEKMNVYAYISMIEVLLKLLIVYMLLIIDYDKLIVYAFLMFLVQIFMRILYGAYSNRTFKVAKYKFLWDKKIFKEMFTFACWTLIGNGASVAYTQGVNMLLNMFFGPAVNAARGIAVTAYSFVGNFSRNFQVAINPQITKSYANNDLDYMHSLVFQSSRFSFYLLLIICTPFFVETDFILTTWLKIVPEYTAIFVRFILAICMIESFFNSLNEAAFANGNIKNFQVILCGILLTILPISYFALKLHYPTWSVYVVQLSVFIIVYLTEIYMVHKMTGFKIYHYIKKVSIPCAKVIISAIPVPLLALYIIPENMIGHISICIISVISSSGVVYFIGLSQREKRFVVNKIKQFLSKKG